MAKSDIDRSVILGYGWTNADVARESNDYLVQAAAESAGALIPFCSVNPAWGDIAIAEMERCANAGVRGVGELHPDTQGFDVNDRRVMDPFLAAAKSLDLIVLTHSSEPTGHDYPGKGTVTPDKLIQMVVDHPGQRFILAHWGGGVPFYTLMPEVAESLSEVWVDTAASPFLYDPAIYGTVAATPMSGRVVFGSDYPLIMQSRALRHIPPAYRETLGDPGDLFTRREHDRLPVTK
jgi:hypothetical protein